MKVKIIVEERVSKTIEIDAPTIEQAIDEVTRQYKSGELVIIPDETTSVATSMCVDTPEPTEWFDI